MESVLSSTPIDRGYTQNMQAHTSASIEEDSGTWLRRSSALRI